MDEEMEAPLDDLEALADDDGDLGDAKITGASTGGNSSATGLSSAVK